jgi:hypothetical protein
MAKQKPIFGKPEKSADQKLSATLTTTPTDQDMAET